MSRAAVRVGVGSRFSYDGEIVEVVEFAGLRRVPALHWLPRRVGRTGWRGGPQGRPGTAFAPVDASRPGGDVRFRFVSSPTAGSSSLPLRNAVSTSLTCAARSSTCFRSPTSSRFSTTAAV